MANYAHESSCYSSTLSSNNMTAFESASASASFSTPFPSSPSFHKTTINSFSSALSNYVSSLLSQFTSTERIILIIVAIFFCVSLLFCFVICCIIICGGIFPTFSRTVHIKSTLHVSSKPVVTEGQQDGAKRTAYVTITPKRSTRAFFGVSLPSSFQPRSQSVKRHSNNEWKKYWNPVGHLPLLPYVPKSSHRSLTSKLSDFSDPSKAALLYSVEKSGNTATVGRIQSLEKDEVLVTNTLAPEQEMSIGGVTLSGSESSIIVGKSTTPASEKPILHLTSHGAETEVLEMDGVDLDLNGGDLKGCGQISVDQVEANKVTVENKLKTNELVVSKEFPNESKDEQHIQQQSGGAHIKADDSAKGIATIQTVNVKGDITIPESSDVSSAIVANQFSFGQASDPNRFTLSGISQKLADGERSASALLIEPASPEGKVQITNELRAKKLTVNSDSAEHSVKSKLSVGSLPMADATVTIGRGKPIGAKVKFSEKMKGIVGNDASVNSDTNELDENESNSNVSLFLTGRLITDGGKRQQATVELNPKALFNHIKISATSAKSAFPRITSRVLVSLRTAHGSGTAMFQLSVDGSSGNEIQQCSALTHSGSCHSVYCSEDMMPVIVMLNRQTALEEYFAKSEYEIADVSIFASDLNDAYVRFIPSSTDSDKPEPI
ncbi:uncharacterized protein MONOS_5188 [Monocercomonoides exilis]|uniref:uncharacterized protein n=1 Tax=Monocercomonoides exilis TaxID=2049356 RepID=UPI00355A6BD4|nr:hypothetical protein MONOS_5188 [Monocercomonoides exilis]|eukprot:MONOS_5188.1-p1 / transcript=MONOS_5188.1 / gene=MONOS_5188 / organism=Monocercomonoides_exilis_PA203 / gene_product=unspecified product / transcript_product=unspecified product / location=Mono_scaffold00148:55857-58064(-) / protein_length=665 / sequence_SO=supercontig / SO=protein_coding / is_pseudo=false